MLPKQILRVMALLLLEFSLKALGPGHLCQKLSF